MGIPGTSEEMCLSQTSSPIRIPTGNDTAVSSFAQAVGTVAFVHREMPMKDISTEIMEEVMYGKSIEYTDAI